MQVRPGQKIILNEYFDRYQARGFIKRVSHIKASDTPTDKLMQKRIPKRVYHNIQATKHTSKKIVSLPSAPTISTNATPPVSTPAPAPAHAPAPFVSTPVTMNTPEPPKPEPPKQKIRELPSPGLIQRRIERQRIVGRIVNTDAAELLKANLDRSAIPISNNIGVGILSYNRHKCLQRLIDSIIANTNLQQTTVFVSDDGSTDQATLRYLDELENQGNIVVLKNPKRLGVAGNSNRLIRCLTRFQYGIILNDDIEVLKQNWEYIYPHAMANANMHHLMYRQEGVYGALRGTPRKINNVDFLYVNERPHGAVLAFDRTMLVQCGYFDESYGVYGMEHVDWSQRAWEMSLQAPGFYDVDNSDQYFKLHSDASIISNKSEHLRHAREIFKNRTSSRVGPTENSRVPEITYIVPFRNANRTACVQTVINNIRAQRYPVIHTIFVEQDKSNNINLGPMEPIYYHLATNKYTDLFNKSQAFNVGVSKAITDKVILHDADMLVQGDYTQNIATTLDEYEACHMGKMVLYADKDSTDKICETGIVDENVQCDRIVGYFEGGSLACTKKAYWKVGAFCEDFWGYGVEDCDFYARIAYASKWLENRKFDFLHLWHGRAPRWNDHHEENIAKGKRLEMLSMAQRIKMQFNRLRELGWPAEILALGQDGTTDSLNFHCVLNGNRTEKTLK